MHLIILYCSYIWSNFEQIIEQMNKLVEQIIVCLDGTTATLIMSLLVSLLLPRNYTSFSLDPTLKWSEMTKHLRRDDDNPSEDLREHMTHKTEDWQSDSLQN